MSDTDETIDIDVLTQPSDDGRTVTVTLTGVKRLSTSDIILELEYLISEMSRAEDYLSRPDTWRH